MPGGWVYPMPFIWSFGGKYLDIDMSTREVAYCRTSKPGFIKGLKFQMEMRTLHGVSGGNFWEGTQAMMITGPWGMIEARPRMAAKGFEWDIAHIPIGPDGRRATRQSFDTWTIWADSPHIGEAYRFVSWALSYEGQKAFINRALPSRLSAARDFFVRPDTPQHEEVFVEIMQDYAWMQPTNVLWVEVSRIFDDWCNTVFRGDAPPETAAKQMCEQANGILKELWPKAWQEYYDTHGNLPEEAGVVFAADRDLRGGF